MIKDSLSKDSLAIILLCSNLAINSKIDKVKPFTEIEWSKLAKIILNSSIKRPANLFDLSKSELKEKLLLQESECERITTLLTKSGQLAFELGMLNDIGINVMTRADEVFPKILKEKLKDKCPPVLYYCGDISILKDKLIGVVGSRNIDSYGLEFTKNIAKKIVQEGYSLVSGGAKGCDSVSQEEVILNGGRVVSFIADSMINKVKKKDIREAIMNKKLLLMSAISPKSGFTVYHAMNRNKYIYCLSKTTVVVSSDYNKGGTWAGATENIKNSWVPVVVRYEENIPKGNKELIKLGAVKMEANKLETQFENYITQHNELEQTYYQGDLLSLVNNKSNNVNNKEENIINEEESNDEDNYDVYEIILDKIKESLRVGLSLNEFKEKFNVNKKQASDWLNRAIKDGIVKKLHKPERYKTI
ncbi:MAG: DNA-processing protein DprA [Clostridium sp.]|nr:DNA-processing protein DprA [Clostridium sp.]